MDRTDSAPSHSHPYLNKNTPKKRTHKHTHIHTHKHTHPHTQAHPHTQTSLVRRAQCRDECNEVRKMVVAEDSLQPVCRYSKLFSVMCSLIAFGSDVTNTKSSGSRSSINVLCSKNSCNEFCCSVKGTILISSFSNISVAT